MHPDASAPSAAAADLSPADFAERLWPGPPAWLVAAGLAVMAGIAFVPVSIVAGVSALVLTLAGAGAALVALATPVRVAGGELHAGAAHIPVRLLHSPQALDIAGTRAALGPELDARAHLCQRSWAKRSVRVRLDDPADPTPYWVVSSRHPERLAAALLAAGARPGGEGGDGTGSDGAGPASRD